MDIFKNLKNDDKYYWTNHVKEKMMFYNIVPSRIKRVLRAPHRNEFGIADNTFACMQQIGSKKKPQELWVMYQIRKKLKTNKQELSDLDLNILAKLGDDELEKITKLKPQIIIISSWRYPGISPKKDEAPMPEDIKKLFGLSSL